MFLDEAIIQIKAGDGGKGCVAWRREKGEPRGGPDGGDGGNGGDVIFQADANTDTLSDFMSRKRFLAKSGEHGTGKRKAGARAPDLILKVPPGTIVHREGKLIADLAHDGDRVLAAKGGRGGYGNAHFVAATRQAPDFAELGGPGEERLIKLELKLVADVGIIGYPSVGKSSLIAAVSAARPKIADYPFTTLVPNLGVVRIAGRECVLCDVPGLIEGASEGKGLGDTFLKHIERCGILLHVLDVGRDDLVADYEAIRKELKAYSPALAEKPEFVVLNKIDLVGGDASDWVKELKKAKITVFGTISAATKKGTLELLKKLLPTIVKERDRRRESAEPKGSSEIPVLRPHLESSRMGSYEIERDAAGNILVRGKRIEEFAAMTNFASPGARKRFFDVLERTGLLKELGKQRKNEENVSIGKLRIDEYL